jgi:hypothetical protein
MVKGTAPTFSQDPYISLIAEKALEKLDGWIEGLSPCQQHDQTTAIHRTYKIR